MSFSDQLRSIRDRVRQLPVVGTWLERRHRRGFATRIDYNTYCGVYPNFASALAAVPKSLPTGYDHPETALQYAEVFTVRVFAYDYPALFWLAHLIGRGCNSVCDFGGNIGLKYYAYRAYLDYPPGLRWTVHEVPAVVAAGTEWARDNDTHHQLTFSANRNDADGQDILFASGCIQYLDYPLWDLLAGLPNPPRHVLITVLPLHPERSFFTVQNIGTQYCVYGVTAYRQFISHMEKAGYAVRDHWEQPDRQVYIPFHPEYRVEKYHGFLFSRKDG